MTTTPLTLALDELADAVAAAPSASVTAATLGHVVRDLERVAGASLGTTDGDPVVVLHRRFARAHRLLLAGDAADLHTDRVRDHVLALTGRSERTTSPDRQLVTAGRS